MTIKIKMMSVYLIIILLSMITSLSVTFYIFIPGVHIKKILMAYFITLGMAITSSFIFYFLIAKIIVKPIRAIKTRIDNLNNGKDNGNMYRKGIRKDEIVGLNSSFNKFLNNLSILINLIRKRADILRENDNKLTDNIHKTSSEIFESNTLNSIITGKMLFQNRSIQDSAVNSEEIVALWNEHLKLINVQAAAVEESSSAIIQLVTSIKNTFKTTDRVNSYAENLLSISEKGSKAIEESVSSIFQVSIISGELNEMMGIITEIAAQTDLLAINAAIEAAHAGDFGRGFAIVADEIRNLAVQTSKKAKYISEKLNISNEKVKSASIISNEAGELFKEIFSMVSNVVNYIRDIRFTTEEQSAGVNQLTNSLKTLNDLTDDIKISSSSMKEQMDCLIKKMFELKGVAKETIDNTEILGRSMETVQKEIKNVKELTEKNSESIRVLKKDIKNFNIMEDK